MRGFKGNPQTLAFGPPVPVFIGWTKEQAWFLETLFTGDISITMWQAWHKRQERIRETLRASHVYHVLGEKVFARYCNSHRRAISVVWRWGFIALTPPPFQMLLAAAGAIYLRSISR